MKLQFHTYLNCSPHDAWQLMQTRPLLEHVTSPIVKIDADREPLPSRWRSRQAYSMQLWLLGVLPLGKHTVQFVNIDQRRREIITRESNRLVACWRHTIVVEPGPYGGTRYTDRVKIEAGLLTGAVALFASMFFCYRQYRWRKLTVSLSKDLARQSIFEAC